MIVFIGSESWMPRMLEELRQGRSVRHVCPRSWDGMQCGRFPGLLEVTYSEGECGPL